MDDLQNEILSYLRQHRTVQGVDILAQPFAQRPGFKAAMRDLEARGRITVILSTRYAAREIKLVSLVDR